MRATEMGVGCEAWPGIREKVERYLRYKGVPSAELGDWFQEAVTRSLERGVAFQNPDHAVRWLCVVAANAHIDSVRGTRDLLLTSPASASTLASDVPQTAEARLALEGVLTELATLAPEHRELLLSPATPSGRQAQTRVAVQRHRLRKRLRAAAHGWR